MTASGALRQLANLHGVQLSYYDIAGRLHEAQDDALVAVLRVLGLDLSTPEEAPAALAAYTDARDPLEPVLLAWDGALQDFRVRPPIAQEDAFRYELELEDGTTRTGDVQIERAQDVVLGRIPGDLPLGYHRLTLEAGRLRAASLVISAPGHAHPGRARRAGRGWGVFLPLYAVRTARTQGIGDYTSLAELTRWTGQLGGQFFGTLPLLATFVAEPFDPSPYSPISRLFWSEIFLDLQGAAALLDAAPGDVGLTDQIRTAFERLNDLDLVDYQEVARVKRQALEPLAGCFFEKGGADSDGFRAFEREYPRARDYAAFRAVCDAQHTGWSRWPQRLKNGRIENGDYDPAAAHYHLFAQYAATCQLADVARADGAQLYLDLPIGVHPDGYDVWRYRTLFATGISTGAPPDDFFTQGQDWGFPPFNPNMLRLQGYSYLRAALGTHLRYAGALRLDHVMALHRLYWIPAGMRPGQGVYVRYPAAELYALLCLESHRHRALIVGEDLGTVPPEVRDEMNEHQIARMFVVQFELQTDTHDPLSQPAVNTIVGLNTHDMPTFEAFRRGLDADLRGELGLIDQDEVQRVRHARRELLQALIEQLKRAGFLHGPAQPEQVRDALLAFLAASPARMLLVGLEDLWREERPQNVPGTSIERPNWRRRARPPLEEIMNSPEITAVLNRLDEIRREP